MSGETPPAEPQEEEEGGGELPTLAELARRAEVLAAQIREHEERLGKRAT